METQIPPQENVQIDPERQRKAKEYARIHRRLSFVGLCIGLIGVCVLLFTGLGIWIRDLLHPFSWQPIADWYPLQVLFYLYILILANDIITLPLSYYGRFVLPHRYGLSTMTLGAWTGDRLKGLVLTLVFDALVVELIYALLAWQPQTWWIWVAIVLLLFSVLAANLAPVLIFPLFYKFRPLEDSELTKRLLALAERAHTRVRGVFTFEMSRKTTMANAALMGLGNTRRIVVGDTMLDRYTPDEIEVVLAHELGHHVHRDIWKLIISQSVLMVVGLYLLNLLLHWAVETQHYYMSMSDAATLPFLLAITGVLGLIVLPITNGYSRLIEYQADEYALQSTGMIEQFKSAMTRLANQNLAEVEPSPIIEFLFYSHPSIRKRLQHADEFAKRIRLAQLS